MLADLPEPMSALSSTMTRSPGPHSNNQSQISPTLSSGVAPGVREGALRVTHAASAYARCIRRRAGSSARVGSHLSHAQGTDIDESAMPRAMLFP